MTTLKPKELRGVRKNVSMVFQHFNLLWSRTVEENIMFPLELGGYPKARRKERVAELIQLVGLDGREGAYPSQLSGGQKQRVGIARALASNPDVLLCDEATSALDPKTTDSILELLGRHQQKIKTDDRLDHTRDARHSENLSPGRRHGSRENRRTGTGRRSVPSPETGDDKRVRQTIDVTV